MQHPYVIDLGAALYDALWDDPARPTSMTVERWAREVLGTHIKEVTDRVDDAHAGLVHEPLPHRAQEVPQDDA
ncbi:MAG: hypothetical protein VB087_12660 [Candidatus Limiplasma sp.]|nr:hypothetical protein [Candidatus Limiplasma sp.]